MDEKVRSWIKRRLPPRRIAKKDAVAGLVLGVESVPDGLALGVLAGVNPLAGLYGYLFGTLGGALATGTGVMAVQVTGATAVIVDDVGIGRMPDPANALYTLSILVGVMMIGAGLLGLGNVLRFVPRAVMVGFITGIAVNMILGQLGNFTGYEATGANRVMRTLDLLFHFWQIHLATFGVGIVTLVLIVLLTWTRLGALGLVVAIVAGSGLAELFARKGHPVALVGDVATVGGLPLPTLPDPGLVFELMVPAVAIAFVALVQGAGVASAFPDPSGEPARASRDFIGQGVGSVISGLFRGMPASASMSATALNVQAGARTRLSLFIAAGVMAVVVLALGPLVGYVAFPSLAALLIVVGFGTIRPGQITLALRSGKRQTAVLSVTFVLTILIPVQYAVMGGALLGILLFVVQQANQFTLRQLVMTENTYLREVDPPKEVSPGEVVILQPHGNLFFASADAFDTKLPMVTSESRNAVVIMRLRGIDDLGVSVAQILVDYSSSLRDVDSRLIVNGGEELRYRLLRSGSLAQLGEENYYVSSEWRGRVLAEAYADARAWVAERGPG